MHECAVVVAHPDDESLFFGGVIARRRDVRWHLICVTDGSGGGDPAVRSLELRAACHDLGIEKVDELRFPDRTRRPLAVDKLVPVLRATVSAHMVVTHSIHDVHPHHQQVLLACCLAFGCERVSMYDPCIPLNGADQRQKRSLLASSYPSQFRSEELMRRYEWWLEGVRAPDLSVLDRLPLDARLLPDALWNTALTSELVSYPTRPCAVVDLTSVNVSLPLSDAVVAVDQARQRDVAGCLVHTIAERVLAAGKPHHMAWFVGLRSILEHAAAQRLLTVFVGKSGQPESAWISVDANWHLALRDAQAPTDQTTLAALECAACLSGAKSLWLPPDDPLVDVAEAAHPERISWGTSRPAPLARVLWATLP